MTEPKPKIAPQLSTGFRKIVTGGSHKSEFHQPVSSELPERGCRTFDGLAWGGESG